MDIYHQTMRRNNAKEYYYFSRAYFQKLMKTLQGSFRLFNVWHESTIVSTELVLCSERYVYSFLGGTLVEYYPLRANDLIKYEIIKWSKETGHIAFILGGDYEKNDGIFRYKKSFAGNSVVPFYVGCAVHNQKVYEELIKMRMKIGRPNEKLFPIYRIHADESKS